MDDKTETRQTQILNANIKTLQSVPDIIKIVEQFQIGYTVNTNEDSVENFKKEFPFKSYSQIGDLIFIIYEFCIRLKFAYKKELEELRKKTQKKTNIGFISKGKGLTRGATVEDAEKSYQEQANQLRIVDCKDCKSFIRN